MNNKKKSAVKKEIVSTNIEKFKTNQLISENENTNHSFLKQNLTVKADNSIKNKSKKRPASEDSDSSSDSDSSVSSDDYIARKKSKKSTKNKCLLNNLYMKKYLKKFENSQLNVKNEINILREDIRTKIVKFQNLVNLQENIPKLSTYEFIGLPCKTNDGFIEFENECNRNEDAKLGLMELFVQTKNSDPTNYVKLCMRKILTDNASINFTWLGFQQNTPVKEFLIMKLLRDACMMKFRNFNHHDFANAIQKWFYDAKDRAKKHEKIIARNKTKN